MPKQSGALGNLCANGTLTQRALVDGICDLCQRQVGTTKTGLVKKHVFQPKNPSAKTRSENSLSNLSARAFERTRGKR